ncbi:MAG: hypothetical protein K0U84_06125 [Actinomycetia bacterium]|nr:hypothetical protein [Actinomycetes bacterium]
MGVATKDLDGFLDRFFGLPHNRYWDRNFQSQTGERLRPFLESMSTDSEAPYILPRLGPGQEDRLIYVVPRSGDQAMAVREWVDAFVVPSYAPYSARTLDLNDPIEAALVEFVGHRGILLLDVRTETGASLWAALQRLIEAVGRKPIGVGIAPLPLSRLLAEFDLALAAGQSAASAALLDRLSGNGLSGSNYTNLLIKRLARLGSYGELLRLPGLKSVAHSNPPGPVKDAILAAIYYQLVESPLDAGDIEAAKEALLDRGDLVPPLVTKPYAGFGPKSLKVLAIAAVVRQGDGLGDQLVRVPGVVEMLAELRVDVAGTVVREVEEQPAGSHDASVRVEEPIAEIPAADGNAAEPATPLEAELAPQPTLSSEALGSSEPGVTTKEQAAQPVSWAQLFSAIGAGVDVCDLLANEQWRGWPAPSTDDEEIAAVIADLDDSSASRVWSLAGPFIDADDFGIPAPKAAQALIDIALLQGKFRPADLAGLVALTDIVLRSAPADGDYARLVDDLSADIDRWVSIERSSVELDLVDMLARYAAPDPEARLRLTTRLLEPLSRQRARIGSDELRMARSLDQELELGLVWDPPVGVQSTPQRIEGNLLLYSLDEAILSRVRSALAEVAPGLNVRSSHDRVGNSQLRDWSRRADYIVLAIRCAKHAATGFIRQHANKRAIIVEANGGGSASLLRAAMDAIKTGPDTARDVVYDVVV